MSGSLSPSHVAGRSLPVELELPSGMFFEALDYNPGNDRSKSLVDTQGRVARHRAARKSDVHQMLDDLLRLNAAAHAADRQGNLAAHWDSIVLAVGKLSALVSRVSSQIDSAESRFEEASAPAGPSPELHAPPVPPAGVVSPASPAGALSSPVHAVVTPKMAFVQVPKDLSMSSRVRRTS